MRKSRACVLMMTLALLLAACGGKGGRDEANDRLNEIRTTYLSMTACSGHVDMRADYGLRVYDYGVDFIWEKEGETVLTLTAPENVAGTTARIAKGETALEYDGVMMATGPLDSAGLTPIDVLPALLNYARQGYMAESTLEETGELLHVICRDPERDPGTGVEAELWFIPDTGAMVRAEISEDGYTVMQCTFTDFAVTDAENIPQEKA